MSQYFMSRVVLAVTVTVLAGGVMHARSGAATAAAPSPTAGVPSRVVSGAQQPPTFLMCWHTPTSDWQCPDSLATSAGVVSEIAGVTVRLTMRNGSTREFRFASAADAVFFDRASAERFLLPYYWSTRDTTKARALEQWLARPRRRP